AVPISTCSRALRASVQALALFEVELVVRAAVGVARLGAFQPTIAEGLHDPLPLPSTVLIHALLCVIGELHQHACAALLQRLCTRRMVEPTRLVQLLL